MSASFHKEKLVWMYRKMLEIRKFEEKVSEVWAQGEIPGLVHLYIGQEAVATGACAALRNDDYVISTHRGHGHCIAKGADLKKMMAELLGRATGYCRGKGGSMHICVPEIGIVGCSGIAGAGIPIAVGVGLSIQVRGTDQVCVCFFGEGASNTGAFHEGINMAAVWNLPVVFVCENNLYAISVPYSKSTRGKNIAGRGVGYGIPGQLIDGMDVLSVYQVVSEAVARARACEGPTLIECKTYRYRGHFEGDPKRGLTYRDEEQVKEWEKRDPIENFRLKLLDGNTLSEKEIQKLEREVAASIEEASGFANNSPYPQMEEVSEDVFER